MYNDKRSSGQVKNDCGRKYPGMKSGQGKRERKITVKMVEISVVVSYGCKRKENNGQLAMKIQIQRSC
jgi:hypothetical protein